MPADDRATALEAFGYTPRQAAFLTLAALHGGYFVRRHYTTITGHGHGPAVVHLLDTAARYGHIRLAATGRCGSVFHIYARPLYTALGQEESGNRHEAEWAAVVRKLMTVDFALAYPDARFWVTEQEKTAHLSERGVASSLWPRREYRAKRPDARPGARYFVDKMPWFREPGDDRLWIAYVDAETTLKGFRTFLEQYRGVLSSLASGVTYVSPARYTAPIQSAFTHVMIGSAARPVNDIDAFQEYCRLRRGFEAGGLGRMSVEEVRRFGALRRRFATRRDDAAYEQWVHDPAGAMGSLQSAAAAGPACALRLHRLEHQYGLSPRPRGVPRSRSTGGTDAGPPPRGERGIPPSADRQKP